MKTLQSAIECTLHDEAVELEWVESRSDKNIARRSLSADGLEAGIMSKPDQTLVCKTLQNIVNIA